jgi:hypothetical protein
MLGRQELHLARSELHRCFADFGYSAGEQSVDDVFSASGGYAEPLFKKLGAAEVHSFDYSRYEGASHAHDMNTRVPTSYKEQYTVVLDGGSLEHVFNFPVAVRNCMEMVKVGGHYLGISPANNFMGHGFYQFSPELYFSVFTENNGYEILRMLAFECRPHATWYEMRRPADIKQRVTMVNSLPVYLLLVAHRLKRVESLAATPQQSDYVTTWERESVPSRAAMPPSPWAKLDPLVKTPKWA